MLLQLLDRVSSVLSILFIRINIRKQKINNFSTKIKKNLIAQYLYFYLLRLSYLSNESPFPSNKKSRNLKNMEAPLSSERTRCAPTKNHASARTPSKRLSLRMRTLKLKLGLNVLFVCCFRFCLRYFISLLNRVEFDLL